MQNPRAIRGPSTIVNRTVTPRRRRNADLREREYLTPKEVDRLQDAARKHSRYGHRDATAILIRLPPWATRQRTLRVDLEYDRA